MPDRRFPAPESVLSPPPLDRPRLFEAAARLSRGASPVPAGTSAERGHGAGQRSACAVVVARRFAAHASRSVVRSRTRFPRRCNAGPAPLTEDARLDRHRRHERALEASATMPSSAHAVGLARSRPNPCAWRSGRARRAPRRWRGGSALLRPAWTPAKAAADASAARVVAPTRARGRLKPRIPPVTTRQALRVRIGAKRVVTGAKSGLRASGGKGFAKKIAREAFVTAW